MHITRARGWRRESNDTKSYAQILRECFWLIKYPHYLKSGTSLVRVN